MKIKDFIINASFFLLILFIMFVVAESGEKLKKTEAKSKESILKYSLAIIENIKIKNKIEPDAVYYTGSILVIKYEKDHTPKYLQTGDKNIHTLSIQILPGGGLKLNHTASGDLIAQTETRDIDIVNTYMKNYIELEKVK